MGSWDLPLLLQSCDKSQFATVARRIMRHRNSQNATNAGEGYKAGGLMLSIRVIIAALLGLTLQACGQKATLSTVSFDSRALIKEWRCTTSQQQAKAEAPLPDGTMPTIAHKLNQCPFNKKYQIEAMAPQVFSHTPFDLQSSIVYKIKWAIDYQYAEYEVEVLAPPRRPVRVRKIVNRFVPMLGEILELGGNVQKKIIATGITGHLIVTQMQQDRKATGLTIQHRMIAKRSSASAYPLWAAVMDLDEYFRAGTVSSAMITLQQRIEGTSKAAEFYE
jgi:hypothetical protein